MKPATLTNSDYLEKIHDYIHLRTWCFNGDKPAMINFTSKRCDTCKLTTKLVDLLCSEYSTVIDFYTVDIEEETDLAVELGIENITAVMFIPLNGEPMLQPGIVSDEIMRAVISKHLIEDYKSVG